MKEKLLELLGKVIDNEFGHPELFDLKDITEEDLDKICEMFKVRVRKEK